MNNNKNIFYEQQLLAIRIADVYNPEVKKRLNSSNKNGLQNVLPVAESIYYKQILIENDPETYQLKLNRKNYSENLNSYSSNKKKKYENDEIENISYNNYNNEEVEYILVREKNNPYNRKKKVSFNKRLPYREATEFKVIEVEIDSPDNAVSGGEGNLSTQKLKEEFIKDTNSIKIEDNFNTTDNISSNKESKKFYRQRSISRFDFVKNKNSDDNASEDTKSSGTEIPEFVSGMLYKKISTYTFFKKFTCVKNKHSDIEYFEKELKNNNNSWAQFIKSNLSTGNNFSNFSSEI
jgi:hypothetical protein